MQDPWTAVRLRMLQAEEGLDKPEGVRPEIVCDTHEAAISAVLRTVSRVPRLQTV